MADRNDNLGSSDQSDLRGDESADQNSGMSGSSSGVIPDRDKSETTGDEIDKSKEGGLGGSSGRSGKDGGLGGSSSGSQSDGSSGRSGNSSSGNSGYNSNR